MQGGEFCAMARKTSVFVAKGEPSPRRASVDVSQRHRTREELLARLEAALDRLNAGDSLSEVLEELMRGLEELAAGGSRDNPS